MSLHRVVVSLATLGLWALIACSGRTSSDGSSSDGSNSDRTNAEPLDSSSFIAKLCELYVPCCENENLGKDVQPCRDSFGEVAARSEYDPAEASHCLTETRAQSNDPDFCMRTPGRSEVCTRVYRPKQLPDGLPLGAACTSDNDCAPAAGGTVRCARTDPVGKERCQLQIDGHAGDGPCLGTVEVSGFLGQPGFYSAERVYLCHLSDGLYCTPSSTCADAIGVGQPCIVGPSSCEDGNFCERTTKTCAAFLGEGSSCDQNFYACARGLSCNQGTCRPEGAFGARCASAADCGSKNCVAGTCASYASLTYLCGD